MIRGYAFSPAPLRSGLLITGGVLVSLAVLALVPVLLQQTSWRQQHQPGLQAWLVPLVPEKAPDPPARPDLAEPPPPEPEPPEPEMPRLQAENLTAPKPLPALGAISPESLPAISSRFNLKTALVVGKAPRPGLMLPSGPALPSRSRFSFNEVDRRPVALSMTRPAYPLRAKRLAMEGEVAVRFLVDRQGAVHEVTILAATPKGVFDRTVAKTLPHWRFEPGRKDGRTVETWVETTIMFKLDNRS